MLTVRSLQGVRGPAEGAEVVVEGLVGEEEGAEGVGEVGIVTEVTAMDMMEGVEEGLLVAAAVSTGELSRSHSQTSRLDCRGGCCK